MAIQAATLITRIGVEGADSAKREIEGFGNSLTKVARGAAVMGTALSATVTAPLLAAATAVVRTGIDFESAFTGVIKTVNATDSQLAVLRQGIRDMSKELPASAVEIASVAEAAGQLGIETDSILGFTRVMIDLGETTNLTSTQAATDLARLANITGMSQKDFGQLGSSIVALGNNFATTEAEIVSMAMRIAGAGDQVGMTEADILALAAGLSSVGVEAEAGGTAISRVMIDMAQSVAMGGKKLDLFAQTAGMTSEDFTKAFEVDAASALVTFIEGLNKVDVAGGNVFAVLEDLELGDIRVRDALLRAAGASDLFRSALVLSGEAWEENIALTREAELRYGTTESQIAILRNRLTDLGVTLDEAFKTQIEAAGGFLEGLITNLENLIGWFVALPQPVRDATLAFAGVLAAVGPLLLLIGGLAGLIGTLNPALVLVTLGIAAFAAAWAADWNSIRTKTRAAIDGISAAFSLLWNSQNKNWTGTIQDMQKLLEVFGPSLGFKIGVAVNELSALITQVRSTLPAAAATAQRTWQTTWAAIPKSVSEAKVLLDTALSGIQTSIDSLTAKAKTINLSDLITGGGNLGAKLGGELKAQLDLTVDWSALRVNATELVTVAGDRLSQLDWSALRFDVSGLLSTAAERIKAQADQWFGGDNLISRTVDRLSEAVSSVRTAFVGVDIKQPVATFTASVGAVTTVLAAVGAVKVDAVETALSGLSSLVTGALDLATQLVAGANPATIATAASTFVQNYVDGLARSLEAVKPADLGTALGGLSSAVITKLGEIFSQPDFGSQVGLAVAKATGSIAAAAGELVGGIVDGIVGTDWATYQAQMDEFTNGFANSLLESIKTTIADTDWSSVGVTIRDALIDAVIMAFGNKTPVGVVGGPGVDWVARKLGMPTIGESVGGLQEDVGKATELGSSMWDGFLRGLQSWGGLSWNVMGGYGLGTGMGGNTGMMGPPTYEQWAGPPSQIGGVDLAPGMGAAAATLDWAQYIDPLDWAAYVESPAWVDIIEPVAWLKYIKAIQWPSFIQPVKWAEFVKSLRWDSYVDDVDWARFIPRLNWGAFIGGVAGSRSSGGDNSPAPGSGVPGDPLNYTPPAPSPWDAYGDTAVAAASFGGGNAMVQFTGPVTINNMGDIERVTDLIWSELKRRM